MGRRPAARDTRGLSESVQWSVLGVVVLMCLLGLIEAGLLLHGRTVAVSAALAGAKAQSALYAAKGAGTAAATNTAAAGGLTDIRVTVSVASASVTVRVDAIVPSFLGWVTPQVHAESTRPLEGR